MTDGYVELIGGGRLQEMTVYDLLSMSAQTRRALETARILQEIDPTERERFGDIREARAMIARELGSRNAMRRAHPTPAVGASVRIVGDIADWPRVGCSSIPGPGTTGRVVAMGAQRPARRRETWEIRTGKRFYAAVEFGDDFEYAPGSTLPVPTWNLRLDD